MDKSLLVPGIVVYKNVLPNSAELIELLETAASKGLFDWRKGGVVQTNDSGMKFDVTDEKVRDVDTFNLPYSKSLLSFDGDPSEDFDSFAKLINNYIYQPIEEVMDDYKKEFGIDEFDNQDSYQFLKYGKGQFFNNHMDDCRTYLRRISYSLYLNDDYTGGEINFPRFGISYKPTIHDMVVFPASYVYNHSVSMVTEGTRYCIVSWTN
jgi:hypothetical protein